MCSTQCVLALLALYVGLAHSFDWDIALSSKQRIEFYFNGTLTHKEENPLANIITMTSDPVRNRVLFVDGNDNSIYSINTETEAIQYILSLPKANAPKPSFGYDPDSDLWFWSDYLGFYSKSVSQPNTKIHDTSASDIAVDSKEGFIYWISARPSIDRFRFNGSDEEIVIRYKTFKTLQGLVIDPQTQRIYWTETDEDYQTNIANAIIKSADLDGKNIKTLYKIGAKILFNNKLAVSKDYIYWQQYAPDTVILWQLEKNTLNTKHVNANLIKISTNDYVAMTTNYKIEDQTPGLETSEALAGLPSMTSDKDDSPNVPDVSLLCVHGTADSEESDCECEHGYTGDRCEVFVCHNYCFGGECIVSGDGQPTCRCKTGYTGERCEINLCQGYCLHDGVCSLNEYDRPVCKCTNDHKGRRCGIPTFLFKRYKTIVLLKDVLDTEAAYDTLALMDPVNPNCPFTG